MPLVITKPLNVLPILRIKQSKKTRKRSAVWHVGPWQYDTATGRHKVKLTRKVRWESRTRAERAAAKRARAVRRATERAAWDRYFATRDSAAPAPPPTSKVTPGPTESRRQGATRRAPGTGDSPHGSPATSPASGPGSGVPHRVLTREEYGQLSEAQRDEYGAWASQAAGHCGARTRDGGRCQRTGDCPYHSKTVRRGARNAGTGRETR